MAFLCCGRRPSGLARFALVSSSPCRLRVDPDLGPGGELSGDPPSGHIFDPLRETINAEGDQGIELVSVAVVAGNDNNSFRGSAAIAGQDIAAQECDR